VKCHADAAAAAPLQHLGHEFMTLGDFKAGAFWCCCSLSRVKRVKLAAPGMSAHRPIQHATSHSDCSPASRHLKRQQQQDLAGICGRSIGRRKGKQLLSKQLTNSSHFAQALHTQVLAGVDLSFSAIKALHHCVLI
jgi:hypothetical protein